MSDTLILDREGSIAVVTINRPDKLNALHVSMIADLETLIGELSADDGVGVIVLTGAGEKSFIAGADIGGLAEQGVFGGREAVRVGQSLTRAFEFSPKPVIAAINGYCLGGGLEMALGCDLRFASTNARLGLPEVSLGLIPGYGGTQRLPRLIGMGRALQMILTGDPVTAEEALSLGLVNGVFEPEGLMEGVFAVARKIISRGPTAVGLAKQSARRGAQMSLDEGLELEADLFGIISSTDEMREGLAAFLDKRKPSWLRSE